MTAIQTVCSLVLKDYSRLDYCNTVSSGLLSQQLQIFNAAAWLILGIRYTRAEGTALAAHSHNLASILCWVSVVFFC